jgi:hypothetical protein
MKTANKASFKLDITSQIKSGGSLPGAFNESRGTNFSEENKYTEEVLNRDSNMNL